MTIIKLSLYFILLLSSLCAKLKVVYEIYVYFTVLSIHFYICMARIVSLKQYI
jgi:hypothetical protein